MLGFKVSIGLLPFVLIMSGEMNLCYKSLMDIGVDVDVIKRKMLGFKASIGLLPLVVLVI